MPAPANFYRYETRREAWFNEDGDVEYKGSLRLELLVFRYACDTIELALEAFIDRERAKEKVFEARWKAAHEARVLGTQEKRKQEIKIDSDLLIKAIISQQPKGATKEELDGITARLNASVTKMTDAFDRASAG